MPNSLRNELIRALPYVRRYARALTGSQPRGDLLVAESLRDITACPSTDLAPRLGLYRSISRKAASVMEHDETTHALALTERQILLLTSLEDLTLTNAAAVLDISAEDAAALIAQARKTLHDSAQTSILIIEDEPIIAMDLEDLVERCGHTVAGIAHTQADAVKLAKSEKPGLILADINLGDGGDGMKAVMEIQRTLTVPVIFVTAYPERLLTGDTIEPSFVITKPFDPTALAIATYQAITGGIKAP